MEQLTEIICLHQWFKPNIDITTFAPDQPKCYGCTLKEEQAKNCIEYYPIRIYILKEEKHD